MMTDIRNIRDLEVKKTDKEILDFIKKNRRAYPSDIANSLNLDYDIVLIKVKELIKSGRIRQVN